MDDAVPNGILGKQLILTTATVTIKMTPGPFTFRPQKQQEINTDVACGSGLGWMCTKLTRQN